MTAPAIGAPHEPLTRPFVKWAGGKTQLLPVLEAMVPELPQESAYHEPFVGSGALFFHLAVNERLPRRAVISDLNAHLVCSWRTVRDHTPELSLRLRELRATHCREQYYLMRVRFNEEPIDDVERAALFIYMNKSGFNGLYRVNRSGRFNVPCGRQEGGPYLPSRDQLDACSEALRETAIECSPFDAILDRARAGDFVYFDPPYVPIDDNSNFTRYSKDGFGPADQRRLRDVFDELDRRGCLLMLSNSDTPMVHELFGRHRIELVSARRNINRKPSKRGPINEAIVRNFGDELNPPGLRSEAAAAPGADPALDREVATAAPLPEPPA